MANSSKKPADGQVVQSSGKKSGVKLVFLTAIFMVIGSLIYFFIKVDPFVLFYLKIESVFTIFGYVGFLRFVILLIAYLYLFSSSKGLYAKVFFSLLLPLIIYFFPNPWDAAWLIVLDSIVLLVTVVIFITASRVLKDSEKNIADYLALVRDNNKLDSSLSSQINDLKTAKGSDSLDDVLIKKKLLTPDNASVKKAREAEDEMYEQATTKINREYGWNKAEAKRKVKDGSYDFRMTVGKVVMFLFLALIPYVILFIKLFIVKEETIDYLNFIVFVILLIGLFNTWFSLYKIRKQLAKTLEEQSREYDNSPLSDELVLLGGVYRQMQHIDLMAWEAHGKFKLFAICAFVICLFGISSLVFMSYDIVRDTNYVVDGAAKIKLAEYKEPDLLSNNKATFQKAFRNLDKNWPELSVSYHRNAWLKKPFKEVQFKDTLLIVKTRIDTVINGQRGHFNRRDTIFSFADTVINYKLVYRFPHGHTAPKPVEEQVDAIINDDQSSELMKKLD